MLTWMSFCWIINYLKLYLGYSEGKRSRNLDNKQAVLIVAEQLEDGRTGKIGLKHIENFEADTLQCAIGQMTSLEINLTADSYSSYKLLQSIKVAYLKTGG